MGLSVWAKSVYDLMTMGWIMIVLFIFSSAKDLTKDVL